MKSLKITSVFVFCIAWTLCLALKFYHMAQSLVGSSYLGNYSVFEQLLAVAALAAGLLTGIFAALAVIKFEKLIWIPLMLAALATPFTAGNIAITGKSLKVPQERSVVGECCSAGIPIPTPDELDLR